MSDPVLDRIMDALGQFNAGRRAEARDAFTSIWVEIENKGDAFHQCLLSHYIAHVVDDPAEEATWNRRALAAADRIVRERPEASGLSVLSLYPSLHLNLADVLARTGDAAGARRHLDLARQTSGALGHDDHAGTIRAGIERLARQIG